MTGQDRTGRGKHAREANHRDTAPGVSIYRRTELPSGVGHIDVPIAHREVMTWLSTGGRTRETTLSEFARLMGAPRQYRVPKRGYLAHVARVLDRALCSGLFIAVLELDAAPPELGNVGGDAVTSPAPEEPRARGFQPARTWVSIELLDDAGAPVRDIAFELEFARRLEDIGALASRYRRQRMVSRLSTRNQEVTSPSHLFAADSSVPDRRA
jgi:hypothetical protein